MLKKFCTIDDFNSISKKLFSLRVSSLNKEKFYISESSLTIISAKNSSDKTDLLRTFLLSGLKEKGNIILYSFQEPPLDFINITSNIIKEHSKKNNSNLSEDELLNKINYNLDIFISDNYSNNLSFIQEEIEEILSKNKKVKLIIIDVLQAMITDNNSKYFDVSLCIKTLKYLANKYSIAIIATSLLNRKIEDREDEDFHLGDLRDSGLIETHSDNILFIKNSNEKHTLQIVKSNNINGNYEIIHSPKLRYFS